MAELTKAFLRRVYGRDRAVMIPLLVALGLATANWALLLWRGLPLRTDEFIPLHYTIYFGIDLVGPWYGIFFPAGFGALVLLLNAVVVGITYEWQRLLSYVFSFGTVLLELILLIASIFILLLNL